ncbi:hypothetical protein FJZ53_02115 [Candidatus Woesearchaeota archaeon]|nr:hypothetical protein [Candidatus Woesearchaeota archaeon]
MGGTINLPTSKNDSVVHIPQTLFGKRITIQAHDITKPERADDVCDGHDTDQVHAKGDIKLFSRNIEIKK